MRSIHKTFLLLLIGLSFLPLTSALVDINQCDPSLTSYIQFEDNLNDANFLLQPAGPPTSGTYEDATVGRGIRFNGIDSEQPYVETGTVLIGNTGFTIEFWFEQQSSSAGIIFDHQGFVGIVWNDGTLIIGLADSPYFQGGIGTHEYTISNPDNPHHYAIVFTDSSDSLELYLDGTLQTPTVITPAGGNIDTGFYVSLPVTVGDPALNATIDELAIFNEPLPESGPDTHNIDSHYAASLSGDDYCESSSANFSSMTSEFTVDGCTGPDAYNQGATISLARGACSREGTYYCPLTGDSELKDTRSTDPQHASAEGCDFGDQNNDDDYNPGDPMCCPNGYVCNKDGDMTCGLSSPQVCESQPDPNSCSQAGCFWFDQLNGGAGGCVVSPSEFGCGIYTDESSCVQDNYNIGGTGVGTEVCDPSNDFYQILDIGPPPITEIFVVPQSSCECTWSNPGGAGSCELSWDFQQALFGTGDTPKAYTCKLNFTFGSCVDGQQNIDWVVRQTAIQGWASIPGAALTEPGCEDGSLSRTCGEPIIKLPGYSTFALITTIGILIAFYYYKRKEFDL